MNRIFTTTIALMAGSLLFCSFAQAQTPTVSAVVNGASFQNSLSPGTLASIFGTNLAPPGSLNLAVTLNGVPCAVTYASTFQVNVQLPVNAATGAGSLIVAHDNLASAPFAVTLTAYSPALVSLNGSGTGTGYFLDATNIVMSANPARAGDTLTIFGVGLGATNPPVATGAVSPSFPLALTAVQPIVTVGGVPATILYSGLAPGFEALAPLTIGVYQTIITVPGGYRQEIKMSRGRLAESRAPLLPYRWR